MKYEVFGTDSKKVLNMLIYEILKRFSDEEHTLSQQDILKLLKSEYGIEKCDRRTVKANVLMLKDLGIDVYAEDGERYFLMQRELEDEELRWLIDAVLFSKTLSASNANRLIEKLKGFGNKYFEPKVSHVYTTSEIPRTNNKQVMINVSAINDAIDQKKKISFKYNNYGMDFKLHEREREYIANPYQMIAANGFYYLLLNSDGYDDVSYYRIDKMTKVKILENQPVKPMKQVKGLENGLDLPKHMAEHVYMFCGDSDHIKLRCPKWMADSLVDWFGKDIRIVEYTDEEMVVSVKCNHNAMFYWALQYGPSVEVLEPSSLREEIAKAVRKMNDKYNK